MANEISLKFGTFTFDGVTTITSIRKRESKSVKVSPIPKKDGAISETATRKHLVIDIEGDVYGVDYDTKRTNCDALKAALYNGKQKFTTDDDRYLIAQLDDFDDEDILLRNLSHWTASLIVEFPFWLSETLHEDSRIPTSGVGYTINNAGNAPARVKIEITAPAGGIFDNIQVENTTRGETLKYRGNVAATKILEIDNRVDTDDFQVLNDSVDDVANFEGDFIVLSPGNNTIEFTGAAGSTVKISYRDTWY